MALFVYMAVRFLVLALGCAAVGWSLIDTLRAAASPTRRDCGGMGLRENVVVLMFFFVVLALAAIVFAVIDKYLGV